MRFEDLTGRVFGRLTVLGRGTKRRYTRCMCECGTETEVYTPSLKTGATTSCGCYRREFRKKGHDPAVGNEYSVYKRTAREKGRNFDLTIEEFEKIVTSPCIYCGEPPSRKSKPKKISSAFLFNGVDRRDNSIGYTVENSQPCCTTCNLAKRTMSEEVFMAWVEKVFHFMKGKVNGTGLERN